jgi:hypothetical protein
MKGLAARIFAAAGLSALVAVIAVATAPAERVRERPAVTCAIPDVSAPRDPSNPLALTTPPAGQDPLNGAHFFVDGPRHGQAAGEIAQMVAPNMTFPDSYSWAQFQQTHGSQFDMDAQLLAKIAGQEETQNISLFAQGGGPGAIFGQTQKILCNNASADPSPVTVPVLSTFFIYPNGQFCPSWSQIGNWQGTFQRDVKEMASAVGSKRAVILEEIDSIGTSSCLKGKSLKVWLNDLKFESKTFSQLPHAVVYAEAGYSDAQGPAWTAKRLWKAGVNQVEGFYTNGTHFAWSSAEIKWAEKVSDYLHRMSHNHYRAHFVVNTAQNGQGPLHNPHPIQQGIENLCNPPGRGLGRMPTGIVNPTFDSQNFNYLDGFLWTGVPGRSHNSNCPGGPWKSAGVFDPRFALELAQNANQKLGPRYPSEPY